MTGSELIHEGPAPGSEADRWTRAWRSFLIYAMDALQGRDVDFFTTTDPDDKLREIYERHLWGVAYDEQLPRWRAFGLVVFEVMTDGLANGSWPVFPQQGPPLWPVMLPDPPEEPEGLFMEALKVVEEEPDSPLRWVAIRTVAVLNYGRAVRFIREESNEGNQSWEPIPKAT